MGEVLRSIQIEGAFWEVHERALLVIASDDETRACISRDCLQFSEQRSVEDGRDAEPVRIAGSGDGSTGLPTQFQKRLKDPKRKIRLVGEQKKDPLWLGLLDGLDAAAQGRTHSCGPFRVDDREHVEVLERLPHLRGLKAEHHDDRRGAGLQGQAGRAVKQRFAMKLQKLFWLSQASRGPGGKHNGGTLRHKTRPGGRACCATSAWYPDKRPDCAAYSVLRPAVPGRPSGDGDRRGYSAGRPYRNIEDPGGPGLRRSGGS